MKMIQLGGRGGATPGAAGEDGRSIGGGVGGKGGAGGGVSSEAECTTGLEFPAAIANVVHYKGGRYTILGIVRDANTDDGAPTVLYRSAEMGELWVRHLNDFNMGKFWPDGKYRRRFVSEFELESEATKG